jgi:predicted RNA-binding protein with PIN domain
MIYIIDANNLAGKLKILKEKNFDKKLIELVKRYNEKRQKRIILVFDGTDPMGDKIQEGNMVIIYAPRDKHCQSADDKIIELVKNNLENFKKEITVISNDRAIREAMEKLNEETGREIRMEQATLFAKKMIFSMEEEKPEDEADDKSLSEKEVKSINEELLKIWQ